MKTAAARAPDVRDQMRATAYMDLESVVSTARQAIMATELIFEDAGNPNGPLTDILKQQAPRFASYEILLLTEDQFLTLHYLIRKSRDEVTVVYKAWHAAFDRLPPRA